MVVNKQVQVLRSAQTNRERESKSEFGGVGFFLSMRARVRVCVWHAQHKDGEVRVTGEHNTKEVHVAVHKEN